MALDFQILLLPRADYWAWLRACRDYVLTFGANLTSDPSSAAQYMRPSQVVTFPVFEGAFPDLGDPVRWFRSNHDGVRLDPIAVSHPKGLANELTRRVAENDRYGARRRPFHLLWPTDYPVVTQPFGVNAQIYRRYGMPGHEGVDLRALTNSNIYACADGEVYEVYPYPRPHPYGIHVRIQHEDGYKTVYAHLARALVRKGDPVRAGQVIGRGDSTGNSSASHLHLSLKQDGATARRETTYPKDILDPTPFLVWPAPAKPKAIGDGDVRIDRGLNLVRKDGLSDEDLRFAAEARVRTMMIGHREGREAIEALRRGATGELRFVVRWFEDEAAEVERPARFVARAAAEAGRLIRLGVRDFEPVTFPNEQRAGFGRAWRDGEAFAEWFLDVRSRWQAIFPEGRLGFPCLAPGGDVRGRQQSAATFLEQAAAAAAEADWIGIASPTRQAAEYVRQYRDAFPGKELLVTDLYHRPAAPDGVAGAIQYVALCRDLAAEGIRTTALFDPTALLQATAGRAAREAAAVVAGHAPQMPRAGA